MSLTTTASITSTEQVNSYDTADAFLQGGRNRDNRPATRGNAVRIVRTGADRITVYYHRTGILTYVADGRTLVHIGGYATKTTATHIGEYLPNLWDARVSYSDGSDSFVARPWVSVIGQDKHGRGDSIGITGRSQSWPTTAPDVRKCRRCNGSQVIARGWAQGCECDCQAGQRDYGSQSIPVTVQDSDTLVIHPDGTTTTHSAYAHGSADLIPETYACTCKMCAGGFDTWQDMYAHNTYAR